MKVVGFKCEQCNKQSDKDSLISYHCLDVCLSHIDDESIKKCFKCGKQTDFNLAK
mgnify:CR=1